MEVKKNFNLKLYNSFGINASANAFIAIKSEEEIQKVIQEYLPKFKNFQILGGGSNILLTKNFPGLVIKNELTGIMIKETNTDYIIESGGGEIWHNLVLYCINRGISGIENLSLIPGSCGAAPIQNIGAYGVELKDVFYKLGAIDLKTGEKRTFHNEDCEFGYRTSIFKTKYKKRFFITSIKLKLKKEPRFNISYGAIQDELKKQGEALSPKIISEAICRIRESKLPDPKQIGNAGSFFKNPIIKVEHFEKIKIKHPDIKHYPIDSSFVKIPAGWLIEKAGWKGKTFQNYGVHKNQALVLVNYGGAKGSDIYQLSKRIISDINDKFGILLELEVNVI